jgi:DNA-directed RNA polymerase subunit RPC12/RpoP
MYVVVVCYGCGRFLLAKGNQKTKRCPYCDVRLTLDKTKKLVHVKTAQEASNYLRELKNSQMIKRKS